MMNAKTRRFKNAVGDMTRAEQSRERERLEVLARGRDLSMEDLFTCKDCGGHELRVEYRYTLTETHTHSLPCDCDAGYETAARHEDTVETDVEERGCLGADHRVEWEEGERETLDTREEAGDLEVFCQHCSENAQDDDGQIEEDERQIAEAAERADEEWTVRCAGCNREIEFGWSHPERGGRIWPAECGDFNPWKTWPEARYAAAWEAKGWLRPQD